VLPATSFGHVTLQRQQQQLPLATCHLVNVYQNNDTEKRTMMVESVKASPSYERSVEIIINFKFWTPQLCRHLALAILAYWQLDWCTFSL